MVLVGAIPPLSSSRLHHGLQQRLLGNSNRIVVTRDNRQPCCAQHQYTQCTGIGAPHLAPPQHGHMRLDSRSPAVVAAPPTTFRSRPPSRVVRAISPLRWGG